MCLCVLVSACVFVFVYVYVRARALACMCVCVCVRARARMRTYECAHVCVRAYVCVCDSAPTFALFQQYPLRLLTLLKRMGAYGAGKNPLLSNCALSSAEWMCGKREEG